MQRLSARSLGRVAVRAAAAIAILSCTDGTTAAPSWRPGAVDRLVSRTPTTIYISQVHGGGNLGATRTNDFIELFNPGSAAAMGEPTLSTLSSPAIYSRT